MQKSEAGVIYSRSASLSRERQLRREEALTPAEREARARRLEERLRAFQARLRPRVAR